MSASFAALQPGVRPMVVGSLSLLVIFLAAWQWAPGLCWADAENRYVIQHYGSTLMRIRYFAITDTAFLWRADMSNDDGKSWFNDRWTMSARRISK